MLSFQAAVVGILLARQKSSEQAFQIEVTTDILGNVEPARPNDKLAKLKLAIPGQTLGDK